MEDRRNSCLTGLALSMLCLLALTYPVWRLDPEGEEERRAKPTPRPRAATFQYAEAPRADERAFAREASEPSRDRIRKQLDRHALNKQRGFYQRVVDNPEMPEEMRTRFAKERARLEGLAEAHPDLMAQAERALVPPALNPDGSFTPEFAKAVRDLKLYGEWDRMVDSYIEQLVRDSENPDLPPGSRPSVEDIRAAREKGLIPSL